MKNKRRRGKKIVPGTPAARFGWIMGELEKRYPALNPFSSMSPEIQVIAAIDYENTVLREAVKVAQTAIDDWLHLYASEHCDPEIVAETRNRLAQVGTLYYITVVRQQLTKALNGNQN